jgi:hypothetical protein
MNKKTSEEFICDKYIHLTTSPDSCVMEIEKGELKTFLEEFSSQSANSIEEKSEKLTLQSLRNKFKNKYDYNLQMMNGVFNIYIAKYNVDLWDTGGHLTEHDAILEALNYLNKINPHE